VECRKNCKPRDVFFLMDLPINDQDLETIVKALALGGDSRLFFKLKEVKEERDKDLVLKNGIVV
jgi:hypothetical protein